MTSTRSPGWMSAFCAAQTPTDRGSISAAASSDRLSGTGCARCASKTTYWANAPWIGGVAKKRTSGHRLYRPDWHSRHRPQVSCGSMATR